MSGDRIARTTIAVAAALALAAVPAAAQICAGYPNSPGQTSVGLRASFPTGGTTLGVEASRNWMNPMAAFVNVNLLMPDEDDSDNVAVLGGGLAYEVGGFIPAVPTWLSVCPVAGVTFMSQDDVTTLTFPLGVGFGMTLATTETFSINPFVIPQFVLTRISVEDVSTSDNNFGIGAGGIIKFRGVYGGVTLGKIFVDGSDTDITFSGGLTFPARLP
jgi:hypothetical protein